MKLILVAGSWGSGTTAVTGALDSLGIPTFGPHFQSSDPRTRNTFELGYFRELIHKYVDLSTLKHKNNYHDEFKPALEQFRTQLENTAWPDLPSSTNKILALKMPLSSVCIPEICSVFKTKIIMVHRPFEEIEASRIRRSWPSLYGSLGAQCIYNKMFSDIFTHKLSFLGISYGDFINNTYQSLEKIIGYCDINSFHGNLERAAAFVRKGELN